MKQRKTTSVTVGECIFGARHPLVFIAGPCVIESRRGCVDLARRLAGLARRLDIPYVFKASFDKANRTSADAYRGPGLQAGLEVLREVRERFGVPVLTDILRATRPRPCRVVDRCRFRLPLPPDRPAGGGQKAGRVVNVKKAQFLAPEDMAHVVRKIESTGNRRILLTERGSSFGYHNLVADMRNLLVMRELGYPVIFDATHSVQRPGGADGRSGGDGRWAPALARAAVATGCDGVFIETHLRPAEALSDKDNAIPFRQLEKLWRQLMEIHALVQS